MDRGTVYLQSPGTPYLIDDREPGGPGDQSAYTILLTFVSHCNPKFLYTVVL